VQGLLRDTPPSILEVRTPHRAPSRSLRLLKSRALLRPSCVLHHARFLALLWASLIHCSLRQDDSSCSCTNTLRLLHSSLPRLRRMLRPVWLVAAISSLPVIGLPSCISAHGSSPEFSSAVDHSPAYQLTWGAMDRLLACDTPRGLRFMDLSNSASPDPASDTVCGYFLARGEFPCRSAHVVRDRDLLCIDIQTSV
jgi:hypothetical protein